MPDTPHTINSHSAAQTLELGRVLGQTLRGGEIVFLTGSLGAGKSVFARGVAEALGVQRWKGSPTFALIHEYRSIPTLIHADLYRLDEREVENLGLEEYATSDAVILAEWADRAMPLLESLPHLRRIYVRLVHVLRDERHVTVEDIFTEPPGGEPC